MGNDKQTLEISVSNMEMIPLGVVEWVKYANSEDEKDQALPICAWMHSRYNICRRSWLMAFCGMYDDYVAEGYGPSRVSDCVS